MDAFRELTASTEALVDRLQPFFERLQTEGKSFDYYCSIALSDSRLRDEVPAIKAAIRRRERAKEAVAAELNYAGRKECA